MVFEPMGDGRRAGVKRERWEGWGWQVNGGLMGADMEGSAGGRRVTQAHLTQSAGGEQRPCVASSTGPGPLDRSFFWACGAPCKPRHGRSKYQTHRTFALRAAMVGHMMLERYAPPFSRQVRVHRKQPPRPPPLGAGAGTETRAPHQQAGTAGIARLAHPFFCSHTCKDAPLPSTFLARGSTRESKD
jgi:hypothetical protein